MNRWYFVFWYCDNSGVSGFQAGTSSSVVEFFPVKQVTQELMDSEKFREVCVTHWTRMSENEYAVYVGKENYFNFGG